MIPGKEQFSFFLWIWVIVLEMLFQEKFEMSFKDILQGLWPRMLKLHWSEIHFDVRLEVLRRHFKSNSLSSTMTSVKDKYNAVELERFWQFISILYPNLGSNALKVCWCSFRQLTCVGQSSLCLPMLKQNSAIWMLSLI